MGTSYVGSLSSLCPAPHLLVDVIAGDDGALEELRAEVLIRLQPRQEVKPGRCPLPSLLRHASTRGRTALYAHPSQAHLLEHAARLLGQVREVARVEADTHGLAADLDEGESDADEVRDACSSSSISSGEEGSISDEQQAHHIDSTALPLRSSPPELSVS